MHTQHLSRLHAELQRQALKQPFPAFFEDDEVGLTIQRTPWFQEIDVSKKKDDDAGPSVSYADRQLQAFERLSLHDTQCIACSNDLRALDTICTPCGHTYCRNCLKKVFLHAARDEDMFPPRCCGEAIPLEIAATVMSIDELGFFKEKAVEYSTQNRMNCSNQDCAKFIHPSQVVDGDRAQCVHCGASTCIHCRQCYHTGECPEDEALQATLALAQEMGWRRCPSCKTMVGLTVGCYHMTYALCHP